MLVNDTVTKKMLWLFKEILQYMDIIVMPIGLSVKCTVNHLGSPPVTCMKNIKYITLYIFIHYIRHNTTEYIDSLLQLLFYIQLKQPTFRNRLLL